MYCLWPPHSYELGVHVYCLWPVLFVCLTIVLVCIVYTTPITLVNCTSQLPIHVSYNSLSVFYFYYYILKLYLPERRVPGQLPLIGGKFFSQCSFQTSCENRAQLATAWSTGDTCTVCGHPTMSNYFTML